MSWINYYLDNAIYEDGGRGPVKYDCWGLVREVRYKHLGLRKLPLYGQLRNDDPRSFTRAYKRESMKLRECEPEHGAIAAVIVGKTCMHVAVVLQLEGVLWVLEINPEKSARKIKLHLWLREHVKVTFHND